MNMVVVGVGIRDVVSTHPSPQSGVDSPRC